MVPSSQTLGTPSRALIEKSRFSRQHAEFLPFWLHRQNKDHSELTPAHGTVGLRRGALSATHVMPVKILWDGGITPHMSEHIPHPSPCYPSSTANREDA